MQLLKKFTKKQLFVILFLFLFLMSSSYSTIFNATGSLNSPTQAEHDLDLYWDDEYYTETPNTDFYRSLEVWNYGTANETYDLFVYINEDSNPKWSYFNQFLTVSEMYELYNFTFNFPEGKYWIEAIVVTSTMGNISKGFEVEVSNQDIHRVELEYLGNPHYPVLGEQLYVDFDIVNRGNVNENVTVELYLNDTFYGDRNFILEDERSTNNSYFGYFNLTTLSTVGYYDVRVEVSFMDGYREDYSWFKLLTEKTTGFYPWIEQPYKVHIYDWFEIQLAGDYVGQTDINVTLELYINGTRVFYKEDYFVAYNTTFWDHFQLSFNQTGHYDLQFVVLGASMWYTNCWIEVYEDMGGGFEMYINQDMDAEVGQEVWMGWDINSHFMHGMYVNLTVVATQYDEQWNYVDTFVIYKEDWVWIESEGYVQRNINWTFQTKGYYDLDFILVDDIGKEWYEYCSWDIGFTQSGDISLWVEQDYTVRVFDQAWMYLYIKNEINVTKIVDVYVYAEYKDEYGNYQNDLIFNQSGLNIPAYSEVKVDISHEFQVEGYYDILFEVIDSAGVVWDTWCNWDVIGQDDEFFNLWMHTPMWVEVGTPEIVDLYVDSFFNHGMTVDLELWLIQVDEWGAIINENEIWNDPSVWIDANGHFNISIQNTIQVAGDYEYHFRLKDDIGARWDAWLKFKAYDSSQEDWLMNIEQWYQAKPGEEIDMWLNIKSLFNYSKSVDLLLYIKEYDETGTVIDTYLIWDEYHEFDPYQEMSWQVYHVFENSGHYDVELELKDYDTNESYYAYCWWDIGTGSGGSETFDFWINMPGEAELNKEVILSCQLESTVNYDQELDLELRVKHFNQMGDIDVDKTVDSEFNLWLKASEQQTWDVNYQFTKEGKWEIEYRVYSYDDQQDYFWYAPIKIVDSTTPAPLEIIADISSDLQPNTNESVRIEVKNNHTESISLTYLKIWIENWADLTESSLNETLAPGETKGFVVMFNLSEGTYILHAKFDTNIGSFDKSFTLPIGESATSEQSQSSEESDSVIQYSPGFEFFLLPLAAMALVFIKRRK